MLLQGSIGVMVNSINFAFAFFKARAYNTDPKFHQKAVFRISHCGNLSYRQRFLSKYRLFKAANEDPKYAVEEGSGIQSPKSRMLVAINATLFHSKCKLFSYPPGTPYYPDPRLTSTKATCSLTHNSKLENTLTGNPKHRVQLRPRPNIKKGGWSRGLTLLPSSASKKTRVGRNGFRPIHQLFYLLLLHDLLCSQVRA